jgi:hypothetical protein
MKNTPKRVVRTVVSILKQLDAVQPLLAGDGDDWTESKALDQADDLLLKARGRLESLIAQLDPQAAEVRRGEATKVDCPKPGETD